MKGLIFSSIILGVISALVAAILVLSGGKFLAVAEGWARGSTLCFLFSIACSLLPEEVTTDQVDSKPLEKDSEEK